MPTLKSASTTLKIITIIVALIAIASPVYFAIDQSWKQGQSIERERVLAYAQDVLARSEATTDQISHGFKLLADAKSTDPCSKANIKIMTDIDLSSSYIQAIGHVKNNIFECSSLAHDEVWDLGPVDWVSSKGIALRNDVKIPASTAVTFIVVESNGYAAIINKSLPIDATTLEHDVSLAAFSLDNQRIFSSRGLIKPEWLKVLNSEPESAFVRDGYVIAVVKSEKYRIGGLATLPVTYIDKHTRKQLMILVPIGLIAGLIFAASIYYLVTLQISMPTMLKAALRRNHFFMLYQPVINLQTGEFVGAEALMRWKRPSGEMVPPDRFIQAAEDAGLIGQLTKRVIHLISKDAKDLFKKYPQFHLGINLSASDICSPNTLNLLSELALETGAKETNLMVEATERGLMQTNLAKSTLTEIRKQGISVALDDFGTGYSSLSYLESFKIDYLKIDKSFVDKIGTDAPTSFVVLHIIEMAKSLKIQMIAEGVETETQAQFLRERGVQFAQGWLFGKPMLIHEAIRLFTKKTFNS